MDCGESGGLIVDSMIDERTQVKDTASDSAQVGI